MNLETIIDESEPTIVESEIVESKEPSTKKKNNTELIITIVLIVVIIGVFLYINYRKNKGNE